MRHSFWPLFRLAEEILLLDLPSLAFSPVVRSWDLESYILIIVYLSSDHKVSSDKAQGLAYVLGLLIPTTVKWKYFTFANILDRNKRSIRHFLK